ncbi:MAG TPA: hypothetical protein VF789_05350 [Thermoanaerobaculia bacterium]
MNTPETLDGGLLPDGVDAATGGYLHPGLSLAEAAALARAQRPGGRETAEAREWLRRRNAPNLGTRPGVDPRDLASAGWGVVFSTNINPAVREALAPLLEHRRRQAAARKETYYREFDGPAGYQPGDTKASFLERHGAGGASPADPREVPYFLLLVGDPGEIPFDFQHQLDVQYAVGRLCFDTAEEYARYAEAVVAAETGAASPRPRRAVLFGPRTPGDVATERMADYLLGRVAVFLRDEEPGWSIETALGEAASKERLGSFLNGGGPALLFTATHGMGFPAGDPRQRERQGALLCHDWPGPAAWRGPIPEDHYFAAADVGEAARLSGLITFHYACHSAGTPLLDSYAAAGTEPRRLAAADFVARLPQRLLAGGALAAIGHVERTWGHSFLWKGPQTEVFEDVLQLLLNGWPVGAALETFGQRYATLASELVEELKRGGLGKRTAPEIAARLWTAAQDARNYLLLGDPAARLILPEKGPVS